MAGGPLQHRRPYVISTRCVTCAAFRAVRWPLRSAMVSTRRKKELTGALCLGIAALIALAVLSYTPADNAAVTAFFEYGEMRHSVGVRNWLGLVGAALAWGAVPNFLGYFSLVLCAGLGAAGWRTLRHQPLAPLARPWAGGFGAAVLLAVLMGALGAAFGTDTVRWSGALGEAVGGGLVAGFGGAAAVVLLVGVGSAGVLFWTEQSALGAWRRVQHMGHAAYDRARPYVQDAMQWVRARLHDTNVDPQAPMPTPQADTDPEAASSGSEDASAEKAPPAVHDPTAPDAEGLRLVRNESDEAPPEAPEQEPPESASSTSVPAGSAPNESAPAPSETPDEPEDPSVIRFDQVRARIRAVQERIDAPDRVRKAGPVPAHEAAPPMQPGSTRANGPAPGHEPEASEAPPAPEAPRFTYPADPDPLFDHAAHAVVHHQNGAVALVQRVLVVGEARATRIVEQLEAAGLVGPPSETGRRDVYMDDTDVLERHLPST